MVSDNTLVQGDQSLLDSLERLERTPEGCRAVYVALSGLLPHNKDWIRLRLAAHLFEPLVAGHRCEVFLLSNGDLVVMGRDVAASTLEVHVERLRSLFRADPASRAETDDGVDLFVTFYELEEQDRDLRTRVEALRHGKTEPWRIINRFQSAPDHRSVEPRPLLQMTQALERLDPRPLMLRQAMVRIGSDRLGRIVCEEFYIALEEVRRQCAPDLNLRTNRWLFQEICRLLDPRTLSAVAGLHGLPSGDISLGLNLTLETVLAPPFERFLANLPADTRLIIEISLTDALTSLDLVEKAAARLHARNHLLALDSVDPRALAMIDPARLAVDRIKLIWNKDLGNPDTVWDGPNPDVFVRSLDPDRLILTRVEDERGILWGLRQNIRTFQGFFVDRIISATTMAGCSKQSGCTLAQCVDRRRAVAGATHMACPNPRQLTAVTQVRALARPPSGSGPRQGGPHG